MRVSEHRGAGAESERAVKLRRPDIYWLVLCIAALIFFSVAVEKFHAFHSANDYIPVYTGARCLLHGCNPYNASQLEQQYLEADGRADELPAWDEEMPLYPPSTLLVLSPLSLLSFPVARVLWILLNGCLFATSAGLILSTCPPVHRWLATLLASLMLVTSGILLALGNPAIFAISLLIIGSCLLLRGRLLPLGALLLMLSLAVKPQIGGLIVLALIAMRIRRRYAVLAVAGAFALLLTAGLILSLHPRSSNWASGLSGNITSTLGPGGHNDPRPEGKRAIADINLQAVTSVFFADQGEFNAAAYAVFLALLMVWIAALVRTNASAEKHLLSVAALAALSLTPVYHGFYDTRMLLITIPAVVIVYQKRRLLGAGIGVLTVLSVVSVQDRVQKIFLQHAMLQSILSHKILFVLLLRQQNLELPLLFCLYVFAIFTIPFPSVPSMTFSAKNHHEAFSQ